MARTRVVDIERDLDQAARRLKAQPLLRSGYGANELLGARDSLACDELNAYGRRLLRKPAWEG